MIDLAPPPAIIVPGEPRLVRPSLADVLRYGDPAAAILFAPGFRHKGKTLTTIAGPVSFTGDSGGWGSYTLVQRVANANLLAGASGCEITQVIMRAANGNSVFIDKVYVGAKADSGDAFDFAASPAPVKFQIGGSDSATLTAGTTGTWTGSFQLPSGKDVLVAFETTTATLRYKDTQTGWTLYWKAGTGDAATVNKTGYNTWGFNVLCISEIKALI